jgi:N-dimethylarginine dimethylaminohydrolase
MTWNARGASRPLPEGLFAGPTMIAREPPARLLMCRPEHFAVSYAINPWMDPKSWASHDHVLSSAAWAEWTRLHHALQDLGAAIELVPSVSGVPDLVFTANAAVVLDRKALLSRFRFPERQSEEPLFEAAFRKLQARGIIDVVRKLPDGLALEGAGDCVWDQARNLFWMGYGQRSDAGSRHEVEELFAAEVVSLELADPRFYHMDTALCPLPRGEVVYFPGAFTHAGRAAIRDRIPADDRIEIAIEDACQLAANAVCIGETVVLSGCSEALRGTLEDRGYRVTTTPLSAFLRSGGSAFCLTLRLDRQSAAMGADREATAVA